MSTPRSRADVVLLRPALKALVSSTPRRTWMVLAPSARAVALAVRASSSSMTALVARLLDRRDHALVQFAQRHRLADPGVERRIRIVAGAQREGRPVHDGRELVAQDDRAVEPQGARVGATEQLDHHRHLHRAGGVERSDGVDGERVSRGEVLQPDAGLRARETGDALFDGGAQGREVGWGGRRRAARGRRGTGHHGARRERDGEEVAEVSHGASIGAFGVPG